MSGEGQPVGAYRRAIREPDSFTPPGVTVRRSPFGETWTWRDELGCERGRSFPAAIRYSGWRGLWERVLQREGREGR